MEKKSLAVGFVLGITFILILIHPLAGERELISLISSSHFSLKVATYSFTNLDIAYALVDAHRRGVDVKVLTSEENANTKALSLLRENGIEVRCSEERMHAKLIIIDYFIGIVGSHNLSYRAFHKNIEFSVVVPAFLFNSFFDEVWVGSFPC